MENQGNASYSETVEAKLDSNMPTKKPPLLTLYTKFLTKDGTLSGFTRESGDLMTNGVEYTDLVRQ